MRAFLLLLVSFVSLAFSQRTYAHVKWFSNFSYSTPPASYSDLNHTAFWALLLLSVVVLGLLVFLDRKFEKWVLYGQFNSYLEKIGPNASLILRVFTGASLLLSWQADSMIAPEIKIGHPFWGWYQFGLALLMLGRRTSSLAGVGMIALYLFTMSKYGLFHVLDYLVYPAIGFFLAASYFETARIKNLRIPALYIGLGFSLCWAALEKIFYPAWGLDVLAQKPALTMGLDHEFFLLACAFVELSLGYLLIIGILQRPLALTITLVFFTTTAFFGKTEVVGHTILHGALLVFIVVGPGGYYPPPIEMHRNLPLRIAFACVNFLIVCALLALPYRWFAMNAYEKHNGPEAVSH